MLTTEIKKIGGVFWRKIGILIVLIPALSLDGSHFATVSSNGQLILTGLIVVSFMVFYKRSVKRSKKMFLYTLIFSFFIEYVLSVGFDMYTYRLSNLPLYIPFAQAVCLVRIFEFSKDPSVIKHKKIVIKYLYIFISVFTLFSLLVFNDFFGFVMTIGAFLLLMIRPTYKLFFLSWYVVIVFIEYGGVAFNVWNWPELAFNEIQFLPSHNPPSGISLFYYVIELGCFLIYILLNNKTWKRLKNIKRLQQG